MEAISLKIKDLKELVKKQKALWVAFDFEVEIKGSGYIPARKAKSLQTYDFGLIKEEFYIDEARFFNASSKGVHVEYFSYGFRKECFISKLDFKFSFWAQKKS